MAPIVLTPQATPRTTPRPAPPTPDPTFVVYDRTDASYDFTAVGRRKANRLVLHVEVRHYPIIEWAPGGDWSQAHTGNPNTWSGYEYRSSFKPKVTNPSECSPPSQAAFNFAFEFNRALDRGEADEDEIIADIAERHRTSPQLVEEGIRTVDHWSLC